MDPDFEAKLEVFKKAANANGLEIEYKSSQPHTDLHVACLKKEFEERIARNSLKLEVRKDPHNRLYLRAI